VASLRWETAVLSMEMRVWIEKLMLVRHIRNLEEGTLARMVYDEQKLMDWPGLAREAAEICRKLEIENINVADLSKESSRIYRKYLTEKCKELDEKWLRQMAEGKEKCEKIMSEAYGKKSYLSIHTISDVRKYFYTRVKMQPFGGNYSKDNRFRRTEWMCRCKQQKEEESHLLAGDCQVYGDLRHKYADLVSDEDMVSFFTEVLARRERLEEEERGLAVGQNAADSASP
jgi:hypothetical protein